MDGQYAFCDFFGKRLKRLICKRGITERRLAGMMGVPEEMVLLWVSGDLMPDAYQLKKAAKCLVVPYERLLD